MQGNLETPRDVDIGKSMQPGRPQLTRWDALAPRRSNRNRSTDLTTVATYVESRFIPQHVMRKAPAGRIHYHAILKHILNPETVDRIFSNNMPGTKGDRKSVV
jgi:hypothetical protein